MNEIDPVLGIPVPLVLTCIKTGKQIKYTDAAYIKTRIDKAGSLENLLKTYVARGSGSSESEPAQPQVKAKSLTLIAARHEDDRVHTEYQFADGTFCNVYAPAIPQPIL